MPDTAIEADRATACGSTVYRITLDQLILAAKILKANEYKTGKSLETVVMQHGFQQITDSPVEATCFWAEKLDEIRSLKDGDVTAFHGWPEARTELLKQIES